MERISFGVVLRSIDNTDKPFLCVYRDKEKAKKEEKSFRDLDSVHQKTEYLKKIQALRQNCGVFIKDFDTALVKMQGRDYIFSDAFLGKIYMINTYPIDVTGFGS